MRILKTGSGGPGVELLQLALRRAGEGEIVIDGLFGPATDAALRRFQRQRGLFADGIAGSATHRALLPYYTGFFVHRIRPGESLSSLAELFSVSLSSLLTANPALVPERLEVGAELVVPLPFEVVPTEISCFSELVAYCVRGLAARYPFLSLSDMGRSAMGRPLWAIKLGEGENRVLYNAAHHANEWICTLLLLKFTERLCAAYTSNGLIYGQSAGELLSYASLFIVPAVNPDGMDISTGELQQGEVYMNALRLAQRYPRYPFPSGWKANARGIDLNLQYPAGWEQAKENKYALGIVSPAPGDFVGQYPLQAPESRAMYEYTQLVGPALILAYHSQGEVIYWKYRDYEVPGAAEIAEAFSQVSGYTAENTPYAAGFAGYKDWFIENWLRPGFTVEVGKGKNPLPLEQFEKIYEDNLGILTLGMIVT